MPFRLYNTLTRSVEDFTPADPANVTFYSCGPTVYDFAHIGNFRSFLLADVLRRWIESPLCEVRTPDGGVHAGPRTVRHVMNITDVGHMVDDDNADGAGVDRMEEGARRLTEAKKSGKLPPGAPASIDPDDPFQIADFYANAFLADARLLGLKVALEAQHDGALMPRPTQKVPQMQAMIRELLDKGDAYIVDGPGGAGSPGTAVYFDVARFPDYGRLSGNTLDALKVGAGGRVSAANQSAKRNPADFLLWKVDPAHKMKWDFPGVGAGYPGWHIECSAMSREALGQTIDLHSGGEDNIFPHHECEIAQSRCANSTKTFARHWFHVRHLQVEGEKMSKSKGNFYTIRDLVSKGFSPAAIRLELIKTHYRANANFTEQGLKGSMNHIVGWKRIIASLDQVDGKVTPENEHGIREVLHHMRAWFAKAMSDDLNMSGALASIHELRRISNFRLTGEQAVPVVDDSRIAESVQRALDPDTEYATSAIGETVEFIRQVNAVLGVFSLADAPDVLSPESDSSSDIDSLIAARAAAKKSKDFAEADRIRLELSSMGIEIKDTPQGTTWSRKPSL